jgi:hypothetical protein
MLLAAGAAAAAATAGLGSARRQRAGPSQWVLREEAFKPLNSAALLSLVCTSPCRKAANYSIRQLLSKNNL